MIRQKKCEKETERIKTDYYEQFYANKMDNLEEMDKYLEKQNLLRLTKKKEKI